MLIDDVNYCEELLKFLDCGKNYKLKEIKQDISCYDFSFEKKKHIWKKVLTLHAEENEDISKSCLKNLGLAFVSLIGRNMFLSDELGDDNDYKSLYLLVKVSPNSFSIPLFDFYDKYMNSCLKKDSFHSVNEMFLNLYFLSVEKVLNIDSTVSNKRIKSSFELCFFPLVQQIFNLLEEEGCEYEKLSVIALQKIKHLFYFVYNFEQSDFLSSIFHEKSFQVPAGFESILIKSMCSRLSLTRKIANQCLQVLVKVQQDPNNWILHQLQNLQDCLVTKESVKTWDNFISLLNNIENGQSHIIKSSLKNISLFQKEINNSYIPNTSWFLLYLCRLCQHENR